MQPSLKTNLPRPWWEGYPVLTDPDGMANSTLQMMSQATADGTVNGATPGTDRHGVAGEAYFLDGVEMQTMNSEFVMSSTERKKALLSTSGDRMAWYLILLF